MEKKQKLYKLFIILTSLTILSACSSVVLKEIPAGGSIPHNEIVYVENDGRCKSGEIIKITGGNNKLEIPRKYECVSHPDKRTTTTGY